MYIRLSRLTGQVRCQHSTRDVCHRSLWRPDVGLVCSRGLPSHGLDQPVRDAGGSSAGCSSTSKAVSQVGSGVGDTVRGQRSLGDRDKVFLVEGVSARPREQGAIRRACFRSLHIRFDESDRTYRRIGGICRSNVERAALPEWVGFGFCNGELEVGHCVVLEADLVSAQCQQLTAAQETEESQCAGGGAHEPIDWLERFIGFKASHNTSKERERNWQAVQPGVRPDGSLYTREYPVGQGSTVEGIAMSAFQVERADCGQVYLDCSWCCLDYVSQGRDKARQLEFACRQRVISVKAAEPVVVFVPDIVQLGCGRS